MLIRASCQISLSLTTSSIIHRDLNYITVDDALKEETLQAHPNAVLFH